MKITSFYQSQHLYDACIDFLCTYFVPNPELWKIQFADSIKSNDTLPQGYMLIKYDKIIGFCGLIEKEMIQRDDLTPFISPLVIVPEERGNELGAVLLEHVRKEAGRLGFFKLYLTTDHIGYYEKYGFREFGLSLFTWGRPTKIYTINSLGVQKLTNVLRKKYPDAKAILLGGSFARNDGIDVQDIDVKVILDGECNENKNETFTLGTMIDVAFAQTQKVMNMDVLLSYAYNAGFFKDAELLYDRDGDFDVFLSEFKSKYALPEYLQKRVYELTDNLNRQYQDVLSACERENEIDIHCRFATYTWTLCDAVLVRLLHSPSWIRGLQKIGSADKLIANKIVSAEGHRHLEKKELLSLMPLYSELWQGVFWDFLKSEIEWLINNNYEPQGFHSLNLCIMMGIENNLNKQELFVKWQAVTGKNHILPMKSLEEFKNFHSEMLDYLLV